MEQLALEVLLNLDNRLMAEKKQYLIRWQEEHGETDWFLALIDGSDVDFVAQNAVQSLKIHCN